jgi:hypothetical protein
MGKDGLPTPESLQNLYDYLSKNYGKDKQVSAEYDRDADYQKVVDYAEQRIRDKNRKRYDLRKNNCKTFAREAIKAGRQGSRKMCCPK